MKWILMAAALVLSVNVQATRFFTESGKVIDEGDQIGKVLIHAGDPIRKRYEVVCTHKKKDYCTRWANAEYWYYQDIRSDNMYWVLTIIGQRVVGVRWYR